MPVLRSNRFERELQIVDQIAHIFDANRQPNQRIADAERFAFFLRHGRMRHERRMIDQAFDAAQTFGQREQMSVFQKSFRSGEIGLSKRS